MLVIESSHVEKHVPIDPSSIKTLPLFPSNYKFLNKSGSLPNSPRIVSSSQSFQARSRSPLTCGSESRLERSKSGVEHRSSVPYGGLDLWANLNNNGNVTNTSKGELKSSKKHGNGNANGTSNGNGHIGRVVSNEVKKQNEMDFKCGALCLYLPGFSKGKPVRARRVEHEGSRPVISQRISLEKYRLITYELKDLLAKENGFWLLLRDVKGALKTKSGPGERKSSAEGRHVRFSISSPTAQPTSPSCITPRLRKAREDFNAFLEAQSAEIGHGSGHGSAHGSAPGSAHGSVPIHDNEDDSPVEEVSPVKPKKP
ncbi:cerebral cavernous malformations 2 protein like protein [Tanacetum coccineum]